ncbi:putative proteinC DOMAIN-CONTAINING PROTEIN 82-RELATED [Salix viminalis]|uniref:NAC domain-containing protein n=1 Tax=Salix viminalis TaxID=40686 RepID=A0A6N2NCG5_SALVM|nr:putative proteinC DOMAIN-CONTAINING PROTEIN 82-RELATED [Salix viminalis]
MYPPASSPVADIEYFCRDEELFMFLDEVNIGSPLPGNVITDVNPYIYAPSNLPEDVWYLLGAKENDDTGVGFWKVKGEACKLFSNSTITGWRTTLDFFEGQVPHEHKTDWVMQKYWITKKAQSGKSKAKEASSLCRVFYGGEQALDHENQLIASLHSDTHIDLTLSIGPGTPADTSHGSSSNPEVNKDDETEKVVATGRHPNLPVPNPPETDYFFGGDYLELLDLDNPASRSSSSDNSSCMTMSSDEYFDSIALLQDIESEINQGSTRKDKDCKLSVTASLRPDEVVMLPASQGSYISIEGGKPHADKTDSSMRDNGHKDLDIQRAIRNQDENHLDEGSTSNSHAVGASSGGRVSSPDGEEKAAKRTRKKLRNKYLRNKYLCFVPYYFF